MSLGSEKSNSELGFGGIYRFERLQDAEKNYIETS
jgi:hypothetical protein